AVHEREGLGQRDALAGDVGLAHPGLRLLAAAAHARPGRQAVHHHEAHVVPGAAIALAGVAQADDEAHILGARAPGYFFSFFSAFSALGSAGASPSATVLPFLMSSGSAAPASSATAASGAATTSSARGATTWAITSSGSVTILTLGGAWISETRTCFPSS